MNRPAATTRRAGLRRAAAAALLTFLLLPVAAAQDKPAPGPAAGKPADDEVAKVGPQDPYTAGDAAAMQKAGIVAFGPFAWADFHTTADVDRVLGERRVLWIETAHLRIGSSLGSIALPADQGKRKALLAELDELQQVLPKVKAKQKRIDPWLRAHLFARRAEACYADFLRLLGRTDADFPRRGDAPGQGPFLGQQDKHLLLLFQKKADLARYFERFCGVTKDAPARHHHLQSRQMIAVLCGEGLDNFDDAAMHRYVVYMLVHNFVNSYRGFFYEVPIWLEEGLAHWHSHRIPSEFVSYRQKPGEAVNRDKQHLWPQKVRQRLEHAEMLIPFEQVAGWRTWEDLGFQEHMQSWSRVDYLMQRDPSLVATLLHELKSLPPLQGNRPTDKAAIDARQQQLLQQLWQFDGPGFDTAWREWVLKTYPVK